MFSRLLRGEKCEKNVHLKFEVIWQLHAGPLLSLFRLPVKKLKILFIRKCACLTWQEVILQ